MDEGDGWRASADAWIADMQAGSFGREHVLDAPMLAAVREGGFRLALDVGCGEGRFCRMMQALGVATVGVDPTPGLLAHARAADPAGDYREGVAEALAFDDGAFDLVVSYLSLIDIPDHSAAIAEMARVLAPGGSLLIANLNGLNTAVAAPNLEGRVMERYFDVRAAWAEWRGIRVKNWHRPLADYMTRLLQAGLVLRRFEEPRPSGGEPHRIRRYEDQPWFHLMEWVKPPASAR